MLVATWIAIPDEITLNLSFTVFNLCFSSLMIIWDRERFSSIYKSYKFKAFSDTLISSFLIFCILGLINYWVFKHPSFIDLSKNNNNSLTDQTVQILKSLEQPISFKVFSNKQQMAPIKALLEMYRYAKRDTTIDLIDVELRPDLVKKHEVINSPTLLVQYNNRSVKILPKSELNITNALLRVSREKDPVLFFTTGHGEADIKDKSDNGLMSFAKLLEGHLFDVQSQNLATLDTLSEKAQVIIIWGPQSDFHDHEIELLDSYLKNGGQLVVALDPNFSKDPVPKLRSFLKSQGIKINNDLVIDSLNHYSGSQGTIPLIKKFEKDHLIVSQFKGPVFFPLASSIELDHDLLKKKKMSGKTLVHTTSFPASWAEKSTKEIISSKVTFHEDKDMKGPIPIMATIESNDSRILVIGNARFILNGYNTFGQNFLLALNSLSWVTYQDRLISFNLPSIKDEPVFISSPQLGVIFYFSVIFLPLSLMGASVFFYRRRLVL